MPLILIFRVLLNKVKLITPIWVTRNAISKGSCISDNPKVILKEHGHTHHLGYYQVGFTKQHFNAMNIIILHYNNNEFNYVQDAQLWAPMNFIIA